nr:coronin-2B-like isoform X2 [Dermatophagoides farinae]
MSYYSKALFKGVRVSKYRHVYGMVARKDQCYDNVQITKNAHDSNFCAANPKFLAIVTESCGGGSFIIIPIDKAGRIDSHAGRVTGHRGQIYDIKWNPFNDNVIASCSDDTTIKLWYIPDEGLLSRNMQQPIIELRGHKRRVNFIEWHPTADNILVSAGSDHLMIVWNTLTADVCRVITCHTETIHSMSFNRDGSLIATTSKDKKLRIIDPRSTQVVNEGLCHHGTKASKVVYLGDSQRLFTVGFSRYSDRQWAVWSERDLTSPLTIENIDSSSGVLFPYYDHDTRMVYVAGKGDGNIRYYETTDEHPYCHYLSQFLSGFPQRSLGMMPKRGCDVYKCEIVRFYKLHATKHICEPISMIVPRKSEQFQSDVFPDTAAPTPALTADQWLSGQNRNPVLFNLKTGAGAKTNKPIFIQQSFNPVIKTAIGERKLEFISKANAVDYREKDYIDDNNDDDDEKPQKQQALSNGHKQEKPRQNGHCLNNEQRKVNGSTPRKSHSNDHFETNGKQNFIQSKPMKSESALAQNFRESITKSSSNVPLRSRLPWIKDDDDLNRDAEQLSKPMCDIVSLNQVKHHLPPAIPNMITLKDDDDDDDDDDYDQDDDDDDDDDDSNDSAAADANTTDDSIAEELAFSATISHTNNSNESFNTTTSTTTEGENNGDRVDNNISPICMKINNKDLEEEEEELDPNPKNERELWRAFQEQRAIIHKLQSQLNEKNKQIEELESILKNINNRSN